MAENRSALIIAASEYQDAGLRQLVAPAQDAEALERVLADPAIGGFAVKKPLLNQPWHQVVQEIETFFSERAKDDLLLFYFSGHGIKDEAGQLCFAMFDTNRKLLQSTAIAASFLNNVMQKSRSKRQVLILDCCYSGAFARGMTHKADATVGTGEYFKEGRGQFILTASDALQYAFEGDVVSGTGVRSVFTSALIEGLKTGEADLDGDGAVSCDELYDYLHARVTERMPQQKPQKWAFAVEGDIIIARNPRPAVKPAALPVELQQSIKTSIPWIRIGAAYHLGDLLQQGHQDLAVAAHAALQQMVKDGDPKVRAVVAEILRAYADNRAEAACKAEEVQSIKTEGVTANATVIPNIHGWSISQVQALQRQTAEALKRPVEFRDALKDGSEGPVMMIIPGGRFLMGSPPDEPERQYDERQHEVEITPFALGKYAVTFEEYDCFVTATKRKKPSDEGWGRGRRPVINIDWFDAVAYAEWLSQQTGQAYRLPTEAEWEYACRAGTTTPFSFGTMLSTAHANYDSRYVHGGGQKIVYRGKTVEVGQFPANAWGLHEMHGNVWEWTGSDYDADYGGAELRRVSDPNSGGARVLRGGAWSYVPRWLRSAARFRSDPRTRIYFIGFRLARTLTL